MKKKVTYNTISPHANISYILGFLQGTLGSVNDYTKEELREKMKYLIEYIQGAK